MRRLRRALVRQQVQTRVAADLGDQMQNLDRILRLAFPNATSLIVNDQFLGFRARDKDYTLLVEVDDPLLAGNYVVKIKPPDKLEVEFNAWAQCRPAGLRHDLVFMALEPVRETDGTLVGLVYQDAQQFVGVDRTASLEQAFLESVLHGAPTSESLANVLTEMFARVGHLLYQSASAVDPQGNDIELNAGKRLETYLDGWDVAGEPRNSRRIAIAALPLGQEGFYDPVEFFRFVYGQLAAGEPAERYVPRMLRGIAHGDLHGRNILVGIVENEAHWPALFDYEDMSCDNLVGWDFVKLETELKMRAYPEVYSGRPLLDIADRICQFETALGKTTEECRRRQREWPEPVGATAEERLANLLLVIRRMAGKHLGKAHGRSADWLDEYYFLLGCYGVSVGRFENLDEIELLGAFVSAGVATARFSYSRAERMDQASGGAGT